MKTLTLQDKKTSIHGNGEIFVDGNKTNLKQWQSPLLNIQISLASNNQISMEKLSKKP